MDRRDLGGWLQGPGASSADEGAPPTGYPGERLGLPAGGPGAIAPLGRRVLGVVLDWAFALLIAGGVLRPLEWGQFAPLVALLAMNVVLVGTAGFTVGHRIAGLRVQAVDGALPGPVRALVRGVLLCLAIPAVFWDRDQRGLHDKAAGTVIVRR